MLRQGLALCTFAVLLMLPALIYGMGQTDSSRYNYVWATQFDQLIRAGYLYPRWLPASFMGFGSPTFFFYPPLAFFVVSAVDLLTFDAVPVVYLVPLAATLMLAVSGVTMHAWLRTLTMPRAAFAGAMLYMTTPYHLTDYYWRGALAEFAFFAVLPAVLLTLRGAGAAWPAIPSLAAAYVLMVCAHLPSAMFVSMFLLPAFALLQASRQPTRRAAASVLARQAGGIALGLGLAAIYLIPALLLQGSISSWQLWRPEYSPALWVVINPAQWPPQPFIFMIGCFAASATAILLTCLRASSRQTASRFWIAVGITCIFLVTIGPKLFWRHMPLMDKLQFPWRVMSVAEFSTVTALAIMLPVLARRRLLLAAFAALLLAYPGWVILIGHVGPQLSNAGNYRAGYLQHARSFMPDASEYLPAGFQTALIENAASPEMDDLPDLPLVQCQPAARRCEAAASDAAGDLDVAVESPVPTTAYVRRFYFPNWTASGAPVVIKASPPLQVVAVEIPAGTQHFHLHAGLPAAARLGVWLTATAFAFTLLIASRTRLFSQVSNYAPRPVRLR